MSITLMSWAWKTKLQTSHRFTLLALCDRADDEGGSLYPSIEYIAKRVGCSPRTAQRIIHDLIEQGWLAVVGNKFGGAPGATRNYQINTRMLKVSADEFDVEDAASRKKLRPAKSVEQPVFAAETGDKSRGVNLTGVTSGAETGDIHDIGRVTSTTETGDTAVTQYTSNPSMYPSVDSLRPPAATADTKACDDETLLQAACRETWRVFCQARIDVHGAPPLRDAKANSQVKAFVKRVGTLNAAAVAEFYVRSVRDAFVWKSCHPLDMLLKNADAYHTQWVTGRTATSTRARQVDRQDANRGTVDDAMSILFGDQSGAAPRGEVFDA